MKKAALLVFGAALAWPLAAGATPGFPGEIQSHVGLSYLPSCQTCHVGTPTVGTATQPFAMTLKSLGLVPGDNASLDAALDQDAAQNKDSDGDGVPDIQELVAGTDPNSAGGGGAGPTPQYGCAVGANEVSGLAGLLGAAALLALALRRRRAVS